MSRLSPACQYLRRQLFGGPLRLGAVPLLLVFFLPLVAKADVSGSAISVVSVRGDTATLNGTLYTSASGPGSVLYYGFRRTSPGAAVVNPTTYPANSFEWWTPGTTTFSANLTGLACATSYTFVAAFGAQGEYGVEGQSVNFTTSTCVTPDSPTGVVAVRGNAQATVNFTAPASDGGATITGYTVSSNPVGGTDSNAGSTGLSHVVTGLTNGTAYTFTVTATNTAGTGNASAASNSVTPTAPLTGTLVTVAYDGFDYTAGNSLPSQSGGTGWSGAWFNDYGSGGDFLVNGTGLTYTGLATTGGSITWGAGGNGIDGDARSLPSMDRGVVYLQFLSQFGSQTGGGTPNIRLYASNTQTGGIGGNGGTYGAYMSILDSALQPKADGASSSTANLSDLNLVIVQIDFQNRKTSMWVNPDLAAFDYLDPPATTVVYPNLAPAFDKVALYSRDPASFDELKVMQVVSPCGQGVGMTAGYWQMLALPCLPSATSAAGVFGTGTASNLTATYAAAGTGWVIESRAVGATPAYGVLGTSDSLGVGTGYWIKSYQAPAGGQLSIAAGSATATSTDVSQVQGCAVAAGCKAITVTTVSGDNRYNLIGNPFPYDVDWSKVRVRVGGIGGTVYTPQQAAGLAASGNASPPVLSNQVNIWNGSSYTVFTDVSPNQGNLRYFRAFWVNVLPGAAGLTVELLIPAEPSALVLGQAPAPARATETVAAAALPWYLRWMDWIVSSANAEPLPRTPAVSAHVHPQALPDPRDWYVRLKVDNRVTGGQDHGRLLGQLTTAQDGFDAHDLKQMAPFAEPYLTIAFPHPDWGDRQGDYASDFHPVRSGPDRWIFEVRARPVGSEVFLSWEGDPVILQRSRLVDIGADRTIEPADPRWAMKGYPVTLTSPVARFDWRYLGES